MSILTGKSSFVIYEKNYIPNLARACLSSDVKCLSDSGLTSPPAFLRTRPTLGHPNINANSNGVL